MQRKCSSRMFKSVQWNSAITTTLVLFLKCRYSKGCRYSRNRENKKEDCGVLIKGSQRWLKGYDD